MGVTGRFLLVVLSTSTAVIGCRHSGVSSVVEPSVYAVVLSHLFPKGLPKTVIVKDMPIRMPRIQGSAPDWLEQFDPVPVALREAADRTQPSGVQFKAPAFPAQIRLVREDGIQTLFRGGIEQNWAAFRKTFDAQGWQAFSEVLLAGDRLDALVYSEGRCGGLCGEGAYFWLHRESPRAGWQIRKRIISWIS